MRRLPFALLLLVLTACATTTPPAPQPNALAASIDAKIATPPFDHALWGILVADDNGRVLYEHNAHTLCIPASNRKLFEALTVTNCLPVDATLPTEIWRDGDDIIIRGNGDPSLGSDRYGREGDFDRVADALRARGITRVHDVVADVSLFDRVQIPGSWKVGNLLSDYSAPVDAIAWDENRIGDRAVGDPGVSAAIALRDALGTRGIAVEGIRLNVAPRTWSERVMTLDSPFVAHLLTTVLKNSHNLYAEMLLKRAGGGSYATAFANERALAAEIGVDPAEFRFVDGSGLAPDDLVTPAAIVQVLRWMNDPARRGFWWSVLAQPANEGTLRRRLTPLADRMRGKTGTVNGVNALSGIVAMPDGHYRYFSILLNHHLGDGDDALRIIDSIAMEIAGTSPQTP